jgi:hypothetical protein
LLNVASKLKQSANCTGISRTSKASRAICNKGNEGISGDRIITNCEVGDSDANTVDIKL